MQTQGTGLSPERSANTEKTTANEAMNASSTGEERAISTIEVPGPSATNLISIVTGKYGTLSRFGDLTFHRLAEGASSISVTPGGRAVVANRCCTSSRLRRVLTVRRAAGMMAYAMRLEPEGESALECAQHLVRKVTSDEVRTR
jgi:hypothetical protein